MKLIFHAVVVVFLTASVMACSSPEEKAASHLVNADVLFAQNSFGKARLEYRNALQLNQNLPDAWYGLARIHEQKKEWQKAYAILTKIRDRNPTHIIGRIMLANILLA